MHQSLKALLKSCGYEETDELWKRFDEAENRDPHIWDDEENDIWKDPHEEPDKCENT